MIDTSDRKGSYGDGRAGVGHDEGKWEDSAEDNDKRQVRWDGWSITQVWGNLMQRCKH